MKNVLQGWKTTLIGLIILIAAIISVFTSASMSWLDASIGIGIGLALCFSPDILIKKIASFFKK